MAAEAVGGTDERALDGARKSLRALCEEQLATQQAGALDTAFELYQRGHTLGLRGFIERAYAVVGRPAKLEKRVKKILDDPRVR